MTAVERMNERAAINRGKIGHSETESSFLIIVEEGSSLLNAVKLVSLQSSINTISHSFCLIFSSSILVLFSLLFLIVSFCLWLLCEFTPSLC